APTEPRGDRTRPEPGSRGASRRARDLLGDAGDVGAAEARVPDLLELEALAGDQLARGEPNGAVGVERDLDEDEHVAGGGGRQIDDGIATEVAVVLRVGGLALPDVEL